MFNHSGKVVLAILAGANGALFGQQWLFYALALFAAGAAVAAFSIRDSDINNQVARAADEVAERPRYSAMKLLGMQAVIVFVLAVFLFHFSNAAMLQFVEQKLALERGSASALPVSLCIIIPQTMMVPMAWIVSRLTDALGRKPIWLLSYAVIFVRGILFTLTASAAYLVVIQGLDGIGAPVFGVLWPLISSDLAKGTGRFGFLQGCVSSAWQLGAFASNFVAGFIAGQLGFNAGFVFLSGVAGCGFAIFAL
jgi:MFS family permease